MGATPSRQEEIIFEPYVRLAHLPDDEKIAPMPISTVSRTKITNNGFHGVISKFVPESKCPTPRSSHFSCFSEDLSLCFVGYGVSEEKGLLDDVWAFDTMNETWTQIQLNGETVSPRTGAKSFFKNGKIYIFGGFNGKTYFSDLHTIDISTGKVEMIHTYNEIPGRTTPIFFEHFDQIFVWGGYDGHYLTELNVLDQSTNEWTTYETNVSGRTAAPYVKYNDKVFAYGSSKTGCFLVIDPYNKTAEEKPTYGSLPPSVSNAGMVIVDHYALFLGGKANSKFCLLFACDLDTFVWSSLDIVPDYTTVSISDGAVNGLGLFLMPRLHSHSLVYEPKTQSIYGFLGLPEENPPTITKISIGEALAHLHMRDDMLYALNLDQY